MAYNNFTTEKLFEDESINILCNQLYEYLTISFGSTITNDNFCLTGTPARIIQGDPKTLIKVVPFITDYDELFLAAEEKIPFTLNAKGAIILTDRIQYVFDNVYIEIWHTTAMGTINTVSNLRVHNNVDIPIYIS